MTALEQQRLNAIVHIVHEYANFVSSAEMVLTNLDVEGKRFKPPINTHISHAFYLNCRKLADFFQNKEDKDNILAEDYVPGFKADLPVSDEWRVPINKQLAHVTYARDTSAKEIKKATCTKMYKELQYAWWEFREKLVGGLYEEEFKKQIRIRKEHPNGKPTEFSSYNLDGEKRP